MLFSCSGTKDLAPACVEILREPPNAVKVSGLFPVSPNLREFRVTLSRLHSEEVYFFDDEVWLFRDGSAFAAEFPCLTLASRAIGLAERDFSRLRWWPRPHWLDVFSQLTGLSYAPLFKLPAQLTAAM